MARFPLRPHAAHFIRRGSSKNPRRCEHGCERRDRLGRVRTSSVQRGPPASTPTTVMPSVKLVFQPVIVVRSRTATSSSWRTVPNRGCATLRSRLGNIPDGSDTNTVIEDLHVAAGGDAGAQWPNRAPLSAAHTVVGRSDACGDAAKNDQNRRATLTNVGVSRKSVDLRCKHGWLSHVTAGQRGCGGGNSSCRRGHRRARRAWPQVR